MDSILKEIIKKIEIDDKTMRSSICFSVDNAFDMFNKMKEHSVELLHEKPQDMGEDDFWFMFKDPSGNILEILGGK